jgi:outer membrane receptor protein involved in Fe transport
VRDPILDLDSGTGGVGAIRGLMYWNMDARVTKNVKIWERVNFDVQFVVTNLFNHPVFYDAGLDPRAGAANFGVTSSQGNNPRQMQFGVRVSF